MTHTPLSLDRVIADTNVRQLLRAIFDAIPDSASRDHGITLHLKRKVRALVKWGRFPPAGDALAKRLRAILGPDWEVSQCGPPERWGNFRTATEENPYEY